MGAAAYCHTIPRGQEVPRRQRKSKRSVPLGDKIESEAVPQEHEPPVGGEGGPIFNGAVSLLSML